MSDLCDVGKGALSFAAQIWRKNTDASGELAVEVLAIASVAGTLISNPTSAQDLAATVLNIVPQPSYSQTHLFTALAAAAAALKVENTGFAGEYVRILTDCSNSDPTDANAVLLRLAIDGVAPVKPLVRAALSPALLRSGKKSDTVSVAQEIEVHSAFGTVPIAVPEPFGFLLQGAALSRFRAYDLPLALRLTRAARYLCEESSIVLASCREFILSSQGGDGGFGDYATALTVLERRGQRVATLRIRMAVTLYALWTLAELVSPDFRIVKELFGSHGLQVTES